MGLPERKERDKVAMRERILSAAKELFLKDGFDHVTIRRIAELIEYSPATVYLYFADKDAIYCALQEMGFQELYKRQQVLQTISDPAERLRECGRIYISFALENKELYDLMFIMRAPLKGYPSPTEWDMGRNTYETLQSIVDECAEKGLIKTKEPKITCFSLWALLHGVVALLIRERAPMVPREEYQNVVSKVLDLKMMEIMQ